MTAEEKLVETTKPKTGLVMKEERKCNEMPWRYRTWLLSGVWPAVYWIDY